MIGDNGSGECIDLYYGSGAGGDECRRNFADDGSCDDYYDDGTGDGGDDSDSTFREEVLALLHVRIVLRL